MSNKLAAPNLDQWINRARLVRPGVFSSLRLRPAAGKRDRRPLEMVDPPNDYYVVTSRRSENPERWSWEIRRKSKPLGVRLNVEGFQSDAAAQFAGKKALEEFLVNLSKEERRSPK